MTEDITRPLSDAISEAEQLIRGASFIRTEHDLLEGLEYLSGRIRMAVQMAFDHDLEHPLLINSTHQFSRQGLDNPDALYWSAFLVDGGTYLVEGVRGTTADLSFQVMDGSYGADTAPDEGVAFDDRGFVVNDDGSFSILFVPAGSDPADYSAENLYVLPKGAKTLIIREVFNDWAREAQGRIWMRRQDTTSLPPNELTMDRMAQRYQIAAKMLVGSIKTWFAFPQFFTYKEPVNTLTVPKSTPGGLPSQFSSIGHYELAEDEAMVVSVPKCADAAYQAIQIGSDWYISTDYQGHQTSLTKAQSQVSPDGVLRYVISERNPGIANWLETLNHRTGVMMLRWQRLTRDLTAEDGPVVEVMKFDELADRVPHFNDMQIDADEYTARIDERRDAVARRMLS